MSDYFYCLSELVFREIARRPLNAVWLDTCMALAAIAREENA